LKRLSTIFFCLITFCGYAQTYTAYADSMRLAKALHYVDSIKVRQVQTPLRLDTTIYQHNPYIQFTHPVKRITSERKWNGKEGIFYCIVGVLLFFAFIRNGFGRYIRDIFSLFFRTSIRQRQIKEQLMQTPLPSLLLNILFVFSGGLFAAMLLKYYKLGTAIDFWYLLVYCVAAIALIYLAKYIVLKLLGWIFSLKETTNAYIFVVFTANKVVGILLLPFLILLGFSAGILYQSALTLCLIVLSSIFLYRFYLSYISIHKQIRINFFHFLLYLAAFEIAPLLLINKALFMFLR